MVLNLFILCYLGCTKEKEKKSWISDLEFKIILEKNTSAKILKIRSSFQDSEFQSDGAFNSSFQTSLHVTNDPIWHHMAVAGDQEVTYHMLVKCH